MPDKKFEWTDELVSDYVIDIFCKHNYGHSLANMEKFKKSKEKAISKDWQIMSFHCDNCRHNDGIIKRFEGSEDCFQGGGSEAYHLKHHKIHSVKRSDGEVFTIGDELYATHFSTRPFIINYFYIDGDKLFINKGEGGWNIMAISKVKPKVPLFFECTLNLKVTADKQKVFINGVEI